MFNFFIKAGWAERFKRASRAEKVNMVSVKLWYFTATYNRYSGYNEEKLPHCNCNRNFLHIVAKNEFPEENSL